MAYEDDIRAIGPSPVDEVLELVRYVTEQFKLVLAQLVILLNPIYGQEIIQHRFRRVHDNGFISFHRAFLGEDILPCLRRKRVDLIRRPVKSPVAINQ